MDLFNGVLILVFSVGVILVLLLCIAGYFRYLFSVIDDIRTARASGADIVFGVGFLFLPPLATLLGVVQLLDVYQARRRAVRDRRAARRRLH